MKTTVFGDEVIIEIRIAGNFQILCKIKIKLLIEEKKKKK